jgi:predicted thioesterase
MSTPSTPDRPARPELKIGLSRHEETVVPPEWSADRMGNPGVPVFSTPALVGWLDVLAHACIVPTLEPGQGTVGTKININHLAATPIGMKVRADAEVVEIDGKRVLVKIDAHDEHEQIASGAIERYVVGSIPKFLERVAAKARGERREKRSG